MTTIKLPMYILDDEEQEIINNISQFQSVIRRITFNICHKKNITTQSAIQKYIKENYILDKYNISDTRFLIYAIKEGMMMYKQNKDKSDRVFGGKDNIIRRSKQLITKDEWKQHKLGGITAEGDKEHKGNRKVDFYRDHVTFKPDRYTKINIPLPDNLRTKYRRVYFGILDAIEESRCPPITVKLVNNEVQITVDLDKLYANKKNKVIKGRYCGIDLNPNYIGVSYFNENKEVIDSKLYKLKDLTGKHNNQDKLKNEVYHVFHEIGRISQGYQMEYIFIEDLKGIKSKDHKKGKWFNRYVNNQFLRNIPESVLKNYGKVVDVSAAFTSTIGNILHNNPDPIAASKEIARRGIENRIIKGGGGKYFPPSPDQDLLKTRLWKYDVSEMKGMDWKEIHYELKRRNIRVRHPVPSSGYRCFGGSKRSGVGVMDSYNLTLNIKEMSV